jgi:putative tricarboxylic transport membrane protein
MAMKEPSQGARGLLRVAGHIVFLALVAPPLVSAADWQPQRNTAIVVGVAAGGALDVTARMVQGIWQGRQLVPVPTVVINKPGAAGAIAWSMLPSRPGDGHLLSFATPTILSNHILRKSDVSPRDFTPIALLANDYIAFVVPAASPIRNGGDLIARLKDRSKLFNIGNAAGAGNANHIAIAKVAKAFGLDPKALPMVVYSSGAISMTNLLGGHIDMVVTALYNAAPHHAAGRARIIAISSPRRFSGTLANVPTWKEQGADVVHSFWRGVIGPKALEADKTRYWDHVFAKTAATAEWKDIVAKSLWDDSYLPSKEFGAFLEKDYRELQLLLNELGPIKD